MNYPTKDTGIWKETTMEKCTWCARGDSEYTHHDRTCAYKMIVFMHSFVQPNGFSMWQAEQDRLASNITLYGDCYAIEFHQEDSPMGAPRPDDYDFISSKGLDFAEIVIAIALLSVALVILIGAFIQWVGYQNGSRTSSIRSCIESTLTELRDGMRWNSARVDQIHDLIVQ